MQGTLQLREERKLERRGWVGCLLQYVLLAIIIALVAALPSLIPFASGLPDWLILLWLLVALGAICVVCSAGFVLMLRLTFWSTESEHRWRQRRTEVLRRLLPELGLVQEAPMSAPSIFSWHFARLLLQFLILVGAILIEVLFLVFVSQRFDVPDLPEPQLVGYLLLLAFSLLFFPFVQSLIGSSWAKPGAAGSPGTAQAQERGRPARPRAVGVVLYNTCVFVLVVAVALPLARIALPLPVIAILALGAGPVLLLTISAVYSLALSKWIESPLRRGEYDRAIGRVRRVEEFSIIPRFYLNRHGVILLYSGRLEEARKIFEEAIVGQRNDGKPAGAMELANIGSVLKCQGKYEEAIKMFEGSIAISQGQAMVYSDLAEALLYKGVDLPLALDLTERAWKNQQASLESRWLSSHQGGQILANRAWALAKLGRHQEADETLMRAFAVADKSFTPVLAGIHLRAGYVMLARGERSRADEYFTQGHRLDPQGHYGRLCAKELEHVH